MAKCNLLTALPSKGLTDAQQTEAEVNWLSVTGRERPAADSRMDVADAEVVIGSSIMPARQVSCRDGLQDDVAVVDRPAAAIAASSQQRVDEAQRTDNQTAEHMLDVGAEVKTAH